MRTIDATHLAQLRADELKPFDLLTLDIDSTEFRYTDCDVPITNLGPEILTDRLLNGSCGSPWMCGSGWSVGSGVGSCDGSQSSNSSLAEAILTAGDLYRILMSVSAYTVGMIRPLAGLGAGTYRSATGEYVEYLTCLMVGLLYFVADEDFVGSLDRCSCRQVIWGTASEIWAPRGFKYDAIHYSMDNVVDQVRIVLDNTDDYLTWYFTGGTPRGSDVTLKQTVLDSDDVPIGAATAFKGTIDAWDMKEGEIEIIVSSELYNWNQRSLALHSASCRWKKFKGTECGYSGSAAWCDRTYARCETLGNAANFGGFRWLPSIKDKEIWWGREWGKLPSD